MDCCKAHALKEADPKYQNLTTMIRAAHDARNKTQTKQCFTLRMITNLQASLDLVRSKSFDFESTNPEVDKVLEENTGNDGESWFWVYHHGAEEIQKLMIQKCIDVANLAAQYDMHSTRIKSLIEDQEKLGEKIVKKAEAAMAAEPAKKETKTA